MFGHRHKVQKPSTGSIYPKQVFEQEDPDDYYNRMTSDPDRPEVYTSELLAEERHLMRNAAALLELAGDRLERF